MIKVYAAGCLKLDLSENAKRIFLEDRLWALFATFEDAEKCILENYGDIFENSYNYALIEEIIVLDQQRSEIFSPKEWWYQASYKSFTDHNNDILTISKIEKPVKLRNIIKMWVG